MTQPNTIEKNHYDMINFKSRIFHIVLLNFLYHIKYYIIKILFYVERFWNLEIYETIIKYFLFRLNAVHYIFKFDQN